MKNKEKSGLILFAHGSRDPRWRLPFEVILQKTQSNHPGPVALAFLECMDPDLLKAIDLMTLHQVDSIQIIPVFLAVGSHLRKDLPALIQQAREKHPDILISATAAIGEQDAIQTAIAVFALNAQS